LLDRSDDLLHLEVKKNQSLIDDIKSLHEKYVEMQGHYESLSVTHEKLSSDYLQRGQALEELRVSHNDLRIENDSLLAQQISASQDSFVPPCMKCLEHDNVNSSAECSNASDAAMSSSSVITNPSSEDTTVITHENARLKTLLETGMYKSFKGHQTLCDVLKKQILN
jgi:hypothetical protein